MKPATRFTVEVAADDAMTAEVLTRQLRIDMRALGPLSLEPVFAPMPVVPDDSPPAKAGIAIHLGVIAASGVLSAAAVKGLFDLFVAFVNRSTAATVTVKRGEDELTIGGISPAAANEKLAEFELLLRADD